MDEHRHVDPGIAGSNQSGERHAKAGSHENQLILICPGLLLEPVQDQRNGGWRVAKCLSGQRYRGDYPSPSVNLLSAFIRIVDCDDSPVTDIAE